jgi:hypothetical protein
MYADDTTVFAADVQSINQAFLHFQLFCDASGALVNRDKCSACVFYGDPEPEGWPTGLTRVDAVKICGVYLRQGGRKFKRKQPEKKNTRHNVRDKKPTAHASRQSCLNKYDDAS